jgi:hypothetical protein
MPGFKDLIDGVGANIGNASNGLGLSFGKGGLSLSANFNQRLQEKLTKSDGNSPLKGLVEETAPADITFPEDLDDERYILIHHVKRVTYKAGATKSQTPIRTIALPVPSNLNPTYAANYKDEPMGVAGAFASGELGVGDLKQGFGDFKKRAESAAAKFATVDEQTKSIATAVGITGAATLAGGLMGNALGATVGAAVGGLPQVISGLGSSANIALNSHMAVLFDGMGFRSFQFSYRFVPRNIKETESLRELIHVLKQTMHPSLPSTNKFLFEYPDEFEIQFAYAIRPWMFKIKRCVLKNMEVNYNGDGVPRFFDNGSPVVVDINLTFQEVEIVTKEDFEDMEDSA